MCEADRQTCAAGGSVPGGAGAAATAKRKMSAGCVCAAA